MFSTVLRIMTGGRRNVVFKICAGFFAVVHLVGGTRMYAPRRSIELRAGSKSGSRARPQSASSSRTNGSANGGVRSKSQQNALVVAKSPQQVRRQLSPLQFPSVHKPAASHGVTPRGRRLLDVLTASQRNSSGATQPAAAAAAGSHRVRAASTVVRDSSRGRRKAVCPKAPVPKKVRNLRSDVRTGGRSSRVENAQKSGRESSEQPRNGWVARELSEKTVRSAQHVEIGRRWQKCMTADSAVNTCQEVGERMLREWEVWKDLLRVVLHENGISRGGYVPKVTLNRVFDDMQKQRLVGEELVTSLRAIFENGRNCFLSDIRTKIMAGQPIMDSGNLVAAIIAAAEPHAVEPRAGGFKLVYDMPTCDGESGQSGRVFKVLFTEALERSIREPLFMLKHPEVCNKPLNLAVHRLKTNTRRSSRASPGSSGLQTDICTGDCAMIVWEEEKFIEPLSEFWTPPPLGGDDPEVFKEFNEYFLGWQAFWDTSKCTLSSAGASSAGGGRQSSLGAQYACAVQNNKRRTSSESEEKSATCGDAEGEKSDSSSKKAWWYIAPDCAVKVYFETDLFNDLDFKNVGVFGGPDALDGSAAPNVHFKWTDLNPKTDAPPGWEKELRACGGKLVQWRVPRPPNARLLGGLGGASTAGAAGGGGGFSACGK